MEVSLSGTFTVPPDMDEILAFRMYPVSGSRFVMVDINETERWAKIKETGGRCEGR